MADTILADLQESIKKNLPAQVGDQLRKRLEEADSIEINLENAVCTIGKLERKNTILEDKIRLHLAQETALDEIKRREKEVEKREMEIANNQFKNDKVMAELKTVEAEKRADQLKEVLGIVFKSPVYKRTYSESNSGTSYTDYNNGMNKTIAKIIPDSKSTQETITEE